MKNSELNKVAHIDFIHIKIYRVLMDKPLTLSHQSSNPQTPRVIQSDPITTLFIKWLTNFPIFLFLTLVVGRGVKYGRDSFPKSAVCDL